MSLNEDPVSHENSVRIMKNHENYMKSNELIKEPKEKN